MRIVGSFLMELDQEGGARPVDPGSGCQKSDCCVDY